MAHSLKHHHTKAHHHAEKAKHHAEMAAHHMAEAKGMPGKESKTGMASGKEKGTLGKDWVGGKGKKEHKKK